MQPVWLQDSKIDFISRMNWCNELILHAGGNSGSFWLGVVKSRCDLLVQETPQSAEWVYGLSWFFDVIILVRQTSYSISLTFECQSAAILLVRPLAWQPNFSEKTFLPHKLEERTEYAKNRVFWIYRKIRSFIFNEFVL